MKINNHLVKASEKTMTHSTCHYDSKGRRREISRANGMKELKINLKGTKV